MSEHVVKLEWCAAAHPTIPQTYSRDLMVQVSPEVTIPASAAVDYLGSANKADPEQLLVSALASCHMLYFLALAEGQGYEVDAYTDNAVGTVSKRDEGGFWVSEITLNPLVAFRSEKRPDAQALERLHHRAHKGCFIANSIKTKVSIRVG
ncbi:OsmC family protein [Pseudomonas brassicacearum]|uniref:OsmC family protein n=1 Tax=Pseudomonas brassicacearum TaxID=930166 RepID=UPI0002DFE584|nr:OsmC family protein [Pseudomonas brassicacearum]ROM97961.1 redox protein [Pseudomonas brassicacearum]